ncbi:MAG: AI-2E family transporter [Candidatus Falkowbacteria bacterium]|nr:AI-2E family transporter [Candidatus Falkowbacteria bacterium]
MPKNFAKPFLISLVLVVLIACYFVFRPFLIEIVVAAIFATVFYRPYEKLTKFFKGRKNLAALLMCLLLVAVIIIPTVKGLAYMGNKSVEAYAEATNYFSNHRATDLLQTPLAQRLHLDDLDLVRFSKGAFGGILLGFFEKSSNWLISGATSMFVETTSFIFSLVLIIVTMFFFFVDGKKMLEAISYLSPLPDKYDNKIFQKFKEVSYTTMVSTFVVAIAQGAVGAIGFAVIGFPPFLAGILVALLSLLPYLGSMIFYVPIGLYYLLMGDVWQGIFILAWGFFIIGTIDNVIRAWMIKGKAQINPIFVVFSVLGGVMLFGFWGVILGPLIVSIAATVIHIYALEFCKEYEDLDILLEGKEDK